MPKGPTLIVFGGSFDPPHQGHLDCVLSAISLFPKARLMVVPSAYPASVEDKQTRTTFDERWQMCQIAFEKLLKKFPQLSLSLMESSEKKTHYSIDTLRKCQKEHPEDRLAFLMGFDQMCRFSKWKDARKILEIASLIAIPRVSSHELQDSDQVNMSFDAMIREVRKELEKLKLVGISKNYGIDVKEVNNHIFINPDITTTPAESRMIRNLFANEQYSNESTWLDKEVKAMIESKKLY